MTAEKTTTPLHTHFHGDHKTVEQNGKRLHRYEFEGYVQGPFDGEVWAQNKQEAIERAQADMEAEGLTVVGKIKVRKV